MFELRPASAEEMALAWRWAARLEKAADCLKRPNFSRETLAELAAILNDRDAAWLVLVIVRSGDYGDQNRYWFQRREVTEALVRDGIRQRKGKRPRPGFSEFVATAAPKLIYFGLHPSASERSKLVRALRVIADGLGIPGDPREEVRRLQRRDRRQAIATRKAIFEAIARGLSGLRIQNSADPALTEMNIHPPH